MLLSIGCNDTTIFSRILRDHIYCFAGVAELADALDLGSSVPDVQVQVLSPASI